MDYGRYKNARNGAWQCILDYKINRLPVIVTDIIKKCDNIRLVKDSEVNILKDDESGITVVENGTFTVVYKDSEPSYRCRFTIAHELGHIFLGHLLVNKKMYRTFNISSETESEANVFARDLLSPACVLHELKILKAEDISRICNISIQSAQIRAERMRELEKRQAFYRHPLEKKVRTQFEGFIKENKNFTS